MESKEQDLFLSTLLLHMKCTHLGEVKSESTFLYTLLHSTLEMSFFVGATPAESNVCVNSNISAVVGLSQQCEIFVYTAVSQLLKMTLL